MDHCFFAVAVNAEVRGTGERGGGRKAGERASPFPGLFDGG